MIKLALPCDTNGYLKKWISQTQFLRSRNGHKIGLSHRIWLILSSRKAQIERNRSIKVPGPIFGLNMGDRTF